MLKDSGSGRPHNTGAYLKPASGATTSWTNSIPTAENNFYRVVQTDP